MTKKDKLKQVLHSFTGTDQSLVAGFKEFDDGVVKLKAQLESNIKVTTLKEVDIKLQELKRSIDLSPLLAVFQELKTKVVNRETSLKQELEAKVKELAQAMNDSENSSAENIQHLAKQVSQLQTQINTTPKVPDFAEQIIRTENKLRGLIESLQQGEVVNQKTVQNFITDLEDELKKLRTEMNNRFSNLGGGSMNRKITYNGIDYLTKFTDINYKAGSNVTFTIANNNQTKMVDVTISATGGGGGGGIVRVISNVAISTAAAAASGTDYVYLCAGTITITLPTAAGNTNLYTIKNVGAGVVTVATTGGETIDANTTIQMATQFTSVDLISNTAAWVIT